MTQRESKCARGFGSSVILAALIGGLAGVTAGLLLASKPGKELRRELAEESKELIEDLRFLVAEVRDVTKKDDEDRQSPETIQIS